MELSGLILAGGRASRMGGNDKGLLTLDKRPLIARVIRRLSPQVNHLVVSANRNLHAYQQFGFEVLKDDYDDYRGPLAGMLKGLSFADSEYLLTVPCDGPFLPLDLGSRLLRAATEKNALAAIAFDGQFKQPAFNLIHKKLLDKLSLALANNQHKLGKWLMDNHAISVDFSDQADAFLNINTLEELARLEAEFDPN
jgi:molybdopterin-guanine dinucleotide biosynthesis protein A